MPLTKTDSPEFNTLVLDEAHCVESSEHFWITSGTGGWNLVASVI